MASLYSRVKLRHERLTKVTADSEALLQQLQANGAVSEDQFTGLHIKLRQCLDSFEREIFQYLRVVPEADIVGMTEDQLKAEDILTDLETACQLNKRRNESVNKSKLPELSLPSFSGDHLKWCEFWDRFVANVDQRNLQESEKLMYLLSCLKDSALETVSGLAATNANYSVAVETLKKRYGSTHTLIDAHYSALNSLRKADSTSASCRSVLDNIEHNIRVLEKLGEPIGGNHLRSLVLSKFPEKVIHEHHLIGGGTDLSAIRSSLDRIITAMEKSTSSVGDTEFIAVPGTTTEALQVRTEVRPSSSRKRKHPGNTGAQPPKKALRSCLFCQGKGHASRDCRKYTTVEARQKQVKGRCLHCLRRNHAASSCKRKIACFRCKGDHLILFCPNPAPVGEKSDILDDDAIKSLCATSHKNTFLQTAVATLQNPLTRKAIRGRVFLDSGSQRSYITRATAKRLNLPTNEKDLLLIFTFGASEPQQTSSPSTTVSIQTKRDITKQFTVNVVPRITDRVPVTSFEYPGVDIVADDGTVGEGVDVLIGNDYFGAILTGGKIQVSEDFWLLDTDFGWVPSGKLTIEEKSEALSVVTYCQCHTPNCPYFNEPDLPLRNIDVRFLWSLENLGITDSPKATRQEEAVRHFNETVQYQEGRYLVKWPWIEYPPDLPSNFGLALGRLKSILKRLDLPLVNEYDSILKGQLDLGIIEVVARGPDLDRDHPVHYLAHHMVKQDGKGRIVYDASAKVTGQKSLNECLYSGPSMLEDLTALLLKFRTKRYGILADVEKAFLQVALQEDDRDVTRFLWLKDTTKEATEDNLLYLRFCRVPFGVVASPFLLTATIRHYISTTNKALLEKVADKCYVDNLVTGADDLQEAKQIYEQTRTTFEQLSMNMRDWISNNRSFMDVIPEHHRSVKHGQVKVLGLMWNVKEDTLKLNVTEDHFSTDPPINTKRKVLRALARVYDPCGFVCPLMLSMKLIFQNICERKCKWDTELPTELTQSVENVMESLKSIVVTEIPRYVGTDVSRNGLKYHLHCFTDASKDAYAAVIYLRVVGDGQGKSVSLLMAKSHVSQTKDKDELKIPKLELLGFLIGSRLLKYVRNHLDLDIEKEYLWSDSLVVLSWMRSNKLLPPFVANRVNEIKRDHPNTEMFYVHTKQNPADIATRPELFEEKRQLWFNGPEFLVKEESCWPQNRLYESHQNLLSVGEVLGDYPGEPTQEVSTGDNTDQRVAVEQESPSDPDEPMETQDLNTHIENGEYPTDGTMELDNPENQSEEGIQQQTTVNKRVSEIKDLQKRHFQEELNGKRTHLARNLDLFVDVDGLLRCRGRMANTTWSYDMKYPILLPKNSEFTDRVIKETHESNYHVGAPHTLSIIRERYWIPQGKAQVMKVLKRCTQCVKHGGGPYRLPATPALPPERVNYNTPFTYTGVDYLGPLFVSTQTGKEKRWIALFTCLTVRAIHLELVKDLSAEECLLALRRFIAARNKPQRIYSDNATCFKLVAEMVQQPFCVKNDIQWKFICQLAPWHGGFYERLIGMVKHCLKRTLEKHLLNDTRLLTVVKEVENVLNSRPLTRVGTEVEHVLCPADFLSLGQCLTMRPSTVDSPTCNTATKSDLVESWKRGYSILEEFKRMFIQQYLASLRERYNNSPKQPRVKSLRSPQVGDLVQVKSDLKNRNLWKVGKIHELIRGSDGECRVARVKTDDSTLTRSVGHLYPLEVEDETPDIEPMAADSVEVEEVTGEVEVPRSLNPTPALDEQPDIEIDSTGDCGVSSPDEVPPSGEQPEERGVGRSKRSAAIRARDKILEWTRSLLALLQ
ncbi:uncharacterized protein LOC125226671 [Leguminivora glycinivorella]|uniref:uncharacterized protein LOC125226671 n=1 Tax=Leguminivora glycinivorella TaxID=1035111 RepID=UPI00200EF12E|nr:uncharacterized protein LOC125226671 [Leguminivora glycinivorella]XP_047986687.1 uncharacterized protein LOC125226671 [Leguminivora glycinivorella]